MSILASITKKKCPNDSGINTLENTTHQHQSLKHIIQNSQEGQQRRSMVKARQPLDGEQNCDCLLVCFYESNFAKLLKYHICELQLKDFIHGRLLLKRN